MPLRGEIPFDCEGVLIFNGQPRYGSIYFAVTRVGCYHEICFELEEGPNFICLCSLRREEYEISWFVYPLEYHHVEGVYESLYLLAPSGVVDPIRLGGPFLYSRSSSSLVSICTENLMSFGFTYEEVRRQCPGLARSGFHVSTKRLYMTNCARGTVPTCVYLNHTWDYFTNMWIWSREIFSRMRRFYT
jgi:hypothetical protein